MPELEIVCPSGLRGVVRGLRGAELDLFANKQEIQRRRVTRKVLSSCWERTLDAGPAYPGLDIEKSLDFNKVLMCDRYYALLQIRVATHGSNYDFRVQCSNELCRKRYEWTLDINKDLDVFELPADSIETFRTNEHFRTEIAGTKVEFILMTGADEDTTVKAQDMAPDMLATTAIIARVKRVEPAGEDPITDGGDIRRWAKALPYGQAMDLVDAMDQVDGGVDTNIEIQCPHCGNLEDITIPLGEDFWTPRRRKRSAKRKVRQKSRGS